MPACLGLAAQRGIHEGQPYSSYGQPYSCFMGYCPCSECQRMCLTLVSEDERLLLLGWIHGCVVCRRALLPPQLRRAPAGLWRDGSSPGSAYRAAAGCLG